MNHNLKIKLIPLSVIQSHSEKHIRLSVRELAELTGTTYSTAWNRVDRLKKARLLEPNTRLKLSAMGLKFLEQHGKNAEVYRPTQPASKTYSENQKIAFCIVTSAVISMLLTLTVTL